MEDNTFDDLLKSKFEDYEHPDPGSPPLASFHERQASFGSASAISWFAKNRTEFFVSTSFLMFTLINSGILWYGLNNNRQSNELSNRANTQKIDSLLQVVEELKDYRKAVPSPVVTASNDFVQEKLTASDNSVSPKYDLRKQKSFSINTESLNESSESDGERPLGGEKFGVRMESLLNSTSSKSLLKDPISVEMPKLLSVDFQTDTIESSKSKDKIKVEVPVARIRHNVYSKYVTKSEDRKYSKGLGINLGAHADVVKQDFMSAHGAIAPRLGLTADWVLSPHLSIETSIDYMNTKFFIKNNFQSFNLPDINTTLGSVHRAEITTRTVSLPVNLKYRWWLTQRNQMIIRAGYAPYFSLGSRYVYAYYGYPYPGLPDSELTINTVHEIEQSGFYGGTLNMNVGLSRIMKDNKQIEVALFYERSVGKVGLQNLNMQLFGLRTAYFIKMR